jgi:hypothetical protein
VTSPARCADLSELAGEPLGATATTAENWLLVEVSGTWQRDVAGGAGLPDAARAAARAWLEATPSSRLLFVRRPGRTRAGARLAFVVRAGESEAGARRFELASAAALAEVDLVRGGEPSTTPLVLVCGHGTRDACCALRGTAVYGALGNELAEDQLWLSSHQGGHRFAANVLVLPAGIHLGRVTPAESAAIVGRALSGQIDLTHYRGRSAYSAHVQAAELAIRTELELGAIADLALVDDGETVRFKGLDGREHVAIVEERVGPSVPASCGAEPERQIGFSARVV